MVYGTLICYLYSHLYIGQSIINYVARVYGVTTYYYWFYEDEEE